VEVRPNGSGAYSIFCDCDGREKLAELRADKLVIMDRRHGKKHIAVLPLAELKKLSETLTTPPVNV
jgi:hypothetical protein